MSDSLQTHGLQHVRPPCPSSTPRVYSNSCPLMPFNHLILCCALLLPPSIFPSIRVFSIESVLHIRWPKKVEHHRINAFELWCWKKLLRVPWTARTSNQSILKEINPEYSLEGTDAEAEALILWPPDVKTSLIGKDPDVGKDWGNEEMKAIEDDMVGWHYQFNGHEFEQIERNNEG